MTTILIKKINTIVRLFKEKRFKEIVEDLKRFIIRIKPYKIVVLSLKDYSSPSFGTRIKLNGNMANELEVEKLFKNWPDSEEEYRRHKEIYYDWNFKKCFIFRNKENGEIAHIQFLLTYEDLKNIKKILPMKIYEEIRNEKDAFMEWSYTFEKYRLRGAVMNATDYIIKYCVDADIESLFSHMPPTNFSSVSLCKKFGFVHIANVKQVQFMLQKRMSGLYFKNYL